MSDMKYYLKQNVVAEPLFMNWYAWAHLVSPATAARNVVDRHLAIMKSYVQTPQVHAAAAKNPKLLGGPFMDFGGQNKVAEVKKLMERTLREQDKMVRFAEATKELDKMLSQEAKGYSLEPLYEKVPEPLRGYVELYYDLNNRPGYRFIESLLYHSEYYDESFQSVCLSLTEVDGDRPFILSTPRLDEDDNYILKIPFRHQGIDELFKMRREPQTFDYIKEALEVPAELEEGLREFLTTEAPEPYDRYQGDAVRTRYFGHACILIETKDISILTDPILAYDYESDIPRYTYSDLPDHIDYVMITHNHQDHILFETLLQIRHRVGTVVVPRSGGGDLPDPNLRLLMKHVGFDNVIELDEMDTIPIKGGTITGVPFMGEHSDLNIRSKLVYFVDVDQGRLMLAADSCNIEPKVYEHVQAMIGDVDVLFLGMECDGAPLSWLYGPLLPKPLERKMDYSRTLSGSNYERARDMVRRFNCKEAYVYAMGMEPWLKYIMTKEYTSESDPIIASDKLLEECRERGVATERLFGEKEILLGAPEATGRDLVLA